MVELDVQMTADGELVCFHDWTLERFGGRSSVVETSESSAVAGIKLGSDGSRIPHLEEALAAIPDSTPLNIEVKRRKAPIARLARRVLAQIDSRTQILVSSFDWKLLQKLRSLAPDLPLAPIERHQPRDLLEIGEQLGAFSLHCHRRLATRHLVERAAAKGFERVLVYTVNDERMADGLLEEGVAGLFTDVPTKLIEHLKGRR